MTKRSDNAARSDRDAYFSSRKAPGPLTDLKVGEPVAYTRYFLIQIGVSHTDDLWHARGKVISVDGAFIKVLFSHDIGERTVNSANLARPGPNLRFCD